MLYIGLCLFTTYLKNSNIVNKVVLIDLQIDTLLPFMILDQEMSELQLLLDRD